MFDIFNFYNLIKLSYDGVVTQVKLYNFTIITITLFVHFR